MFFLRIWRWKWLINVISRSLHHLVNLIKFSNWSLQTSWPCCTTGSRFYNLGRTKLRSYGFWRFFNNFDLCYNRWFRLLCFWSCIFLITSFTVPLWTITNVTSLIFLCFSVLRGSWPRWKFLVVQKLLELLKLIFLSLHSLFALMNFFSESVITTFLTISTNTSWRLHFFLLFTSISSFITSFIPSLNTLLSRFTRLLLLLFHSSLASMNTLLQSFDSNIRESHASAHELIALLVFYDCVEV